MTVTLKSGEKLYNAEELQQNFGHERYELIRGELRLMPNNNAEHGNKTEKLAARVTVYVEDNNLGETFAAETRFVIAQNPDTVLAPDFAFVARERLPAVIPSAYLRLAPDIVLETRSTNDTRREVAFKIAQWLNAGVRIVWTLDPIARTLTVHRANVNPRILTIADTLDGEDVLPGFTYPVQRLFPGIIPCDGHISIL